MKHYWMLEIGLTLCLFSLVWWVPYPVNVILLVIPGAIVWWMFCRYVVTLIVSYGLDD